jgi:hypothetical protein
MPTPAECRAFRPQDRRARAERATAACPPRCALALTSRGLAREEKGDVKGAMTKQSGSSALGQRAAVPLQSVRCKNHDRAIDDLSERFIDPSVALFYTRRGLSYYAKARL